MKTKVIALVVIMAIIVLAFFGASRYQTNKNRGEFAKRIFALGSDIQPVTMDELRASIAAYEKKIEQHVADAARTGSYWKILAIRLQDRGLHGEALQALQSAIYYTPEDPSLHYHTGISAGIMAKSVHLFPGMETIERDNFFYLAEEAFLRAIELDSRYLKPRYSIGVLYVFELERPEDAIPHLEHYLTISRNDVDTMFVLARAFYMQRRFQEAVNLYDRIITLSKDEQKKTDAQENRQLIMGQMYG